MREIRNIQAEKLNTQHKLRKRRQKILTFLASVVVFVTTYVMIIPAITWERTLICELDEHTHCAECYDSHHQLICGYDEHIHNDSCFDAPPAAESIYLCRKTEHTHKADCYFSDGKLKCTLDEHIHSEKCLEPAEKQEISYEDTELLPEGGKFSSSKQSALKKYGIPSVRLFAGHIEWSSLPVGGENTHCVISGHRGLPNAKLFTDLDKMRENDIFTLTVFDEVLTYEVDQIRTVLPQEVDELKITKGEDYCTLVTCTPYGINSHRLLVRGHRIESEPKYISVISEAVIIDQLVVAFFLALPIFIILFLIVMLKKPEKRKTASKKRPHNNNSINTFHYRS